MKFYKPAIAALALALTLTGCSQGTSQSSQSTAASAAAGFPAVTGEFGAKPSIAAGVGEEPKDLRKAILVKGEGPEVGADDVVKVNYVGQLWNGKEFDTSFGRAVAVFSLNGVIKGWKEGLAGTHVGDRVELVIPPDLAYGKEGAGADIPPDATLVFVVDVLDTVNPTDISALKEAKPVAATTLPAGITVSGDPGTEPQVSIAPDAKLDKDERFVLFEGQGKPLDANDYLILHETVLVNGEGQGVKSTYTTGAPQVTGRPLSEAAALLKYFTGVRVGSRVVLTIPAEAQTGRPAGVAVYDILGSISSK